MNQGSMNAASSGGGSKDGGDFYGRKKRGVPIWVKHLCGSYPREQRVSLFSAVPMICGSVVNDENHTTCSLLLGANTITTTTMKLIQLLRPILRFIPEVEKPTQKVPFSEKITWTVCALLVYVVCSNIPLYGIQRAQTSDPFYWMR
eukprot:scaffold5637_cov82-Skeletonema_marinoi.AAC.1